MPNVVIYIRAQDHRDLMAALEKSSEEEVAEWVREMVRRLVTATLEKKMGR